MVSFPIRFHLGGGGGGGGYKHSTRLNENIILENTLGTTPRNNHCDTSIVGKTQLGVVYIRLTRGLPMLREQF